MNNNQGPAALFALIAGPFWLVDGIWGLFSPMTFGVLSTNKLHTVIHIALGIISIYVARNGGAKMWCVFVGLLVLVVGVLRFVPVAQDLVISLFNVNVAVAALNIIVGVLALIASRMSPTVSRA